jgi:hypothetical protein
MTLDMKIALIIIILAMTVSLIGWIIRYFRKKDKRSHDNGGPMWREMDIDDLPDTGDMPDIDYD